VQPAGYVWEVDQTNYSASLPFSYITMMPRMRQALVEFENVEDAVSCVQSCQVESM